MSPNMNAPARGAAIVSSAVKPSVIQCAYHVRALVLADPQRPGEIFEHPQIVERVDVAGNRQRHRPHMGAVGGVGRHQRRLGKALVEIDHDRQALGQLQCPSISSIGTSPCGLSARYVVGFLRRPRAG